MARRWSAPSLVALALLGCLVGTEVEAQDSLWQKPMSKGSPPPQAPQVLPPPPQPQPPKAPQYPQPPQVLPPRPQPPKAPQYPQPPQVLPPPPRPQPPKAPQYLQPPQVLPPRPQPPKAPQYPQPPQVLPPPPRPQPPKAPQYPQPPQVLPPRPQPPKAPQYPQPPQVLPPQPPKAPQYPQPPQVLPPQPPKAPQYPQPPQVLPPQPPKTPQYRQPPQVFPPRPQPPKAPKYPQPLGDQSPQEPLIPQPQKQTVPQKPSVYQPSGAKQPTGQTCEVAESLRIPCGGAGISAAECDAINCCFRDQQCYFGKAVTVQCTKDAQFIVVVARDATLPNIDLESVSLLGQGQGCTHVDSNSGFAIYQFPVTACGSVVTEEPGVIIYENRMSSSYEVAVGDLGTITRDSYFELLFQCRYIGTSVETVIVEVLPLLDPPLPVAAQGPIRVHLRLANGQCNTKGCNEVDVAYSSFYTEADYPVTKVLRDPVYVEVQLIEKTDPNLILTLGRCWTTASPKPHSLPQWDILIDGCPYRDDRYLSSLIPVGPSSGLDFPSHYRRFMFKMFTFVNPSSLEPMNEQVYIHCSTAVCSAASGRNCEPSCFRKKRDVRAAEKKTAEPKVVVSVGPVIIGSPQEETASSKLENLADNI